MYDVALAKTQAASLRTTQSLTGLNLGQAAIITVGITLSLALAAREVLDGKMTVGDFVLVNSYILQLYVPLNFLGSYYRLIKQCMVDVESMFRLMKENHDVEDTPEAKDLALTKREEARVEFDDVRFSYNVAEGRQILRGVSFAVEPGEKIAIVGSSGAGKEHHQQIAVQAVRHPGRRHPNQRPEHRAPDATKRSRIHRHRPAGLRFVQRHHRIQHRVRQARHERDGNHGGGGARAAKAAQFAKFVDEQCKDGYKTLVGERGLRLSGGEKQRVAIASALLKNPPIMIYDEATSSLDTHTEKEIMASINEAAKGRTNIVIAHRLSTIMDSNCIIVLKDGEVAERGDHPSLHDADGSLYRAMWDQQVQSALDASSSGTDLTLSTPGAAAAAKK